MMEKHDSHSTPSFPGPKSHRHPLSSVAPRPATPGEERHKTSAAASRPTDTPHVTQENAS